MSQKSRLQVVLFGLGRAGMIHARNLIKNTQVHLKYIVEEFPDKAKQFVVDNFLDTEVVHTLETDRILADESIKVVVVSTPTDFHEDIILRSVRVGKHVFCEKPIANTYAAVERCYDEAKKYGQTLFCAFVRRFDPTYHSVIQRVRAGEVGQVHVIKITDRDSPYPDISVLANLGNMFYDNGIHDVDLMLHITGEVPVSVCTFAHAFHDDMAAAGDVDTGGILLKFPSGIIGQIDMSRDCSYGYDQRLEVFGSKGMLEGQNQKRLSVVQSSASGITSDKIHFSFPERFADSFAAEMEHFIHVVTKNVEVGVTKEEALHVVRTLDAINKSWKTGQQVLLETA